MSGKRSVSNIGAREEWLLRIYGRVHSLEAKMAIRQVLMLGIRKKRMKAAFQPKRSRRSRPRVDPKDSIMYKVYWLDSWNLYRNGGVGDMRHFKSMFRMSHAALTELHDSAQNESWFEDEFPNDRRDAANRLGAPVILLMMCALAVLGGTPFVSLVHMANISEGTQRRFFEHFCKVGATRMFPKWVRYPSTQEELQQATEGYTAAGLPGCVGSADGVRIRMWSCSHSLKHQNIGKEGYPVRTYQVTSSPSGMILSCTRGWPGKDPDTTICEGDPFFALLRNDNLYKSFEWTYYTANGETKTKRGAWLLVDGGYPDWICLQCPPKKKLDEDVLRWGKMLESMRKDVERTFGILKQRWRILKTGVTLQKFAVTDDAFHTACALHNFLLIRQDLQLNLTTPVQAHEAISARLYQPREVEVDARLSTSVAPGRGGGRSLSTEYLTRRALLSAHFNYLFAKRQIFWPRITRSKVDVVENQDADSDFSDDSNGSAR